MGYVQLLKLATTHIQYMGLLSKLNIPWPASFLAMLDFTDLVNFDMTFLIEFLEIPEIDHRMLFICVAIGLPLFLMMITALVFFSLSSILQIEIAATGGLVILGHILVIAIPTIVPSDMHKALLDPTFFITGSLFIVCPVIYRVAKYLPDRFDFIEYASRLTLQVASLVGGLTLIGAPQLARNIGIGFVALYGCYFMIHRPISKPKKTLVCIFLLLAGAALIWRVKWEVVVAPQYAMLGYINIVLGLLHCMQQVLLTNSTKSFAKSIMKIRTKIKKMLDSGLLTLALFGLSVVFVPVLTYCLDTFLCSEYSCPVGYKFNPRSSRPEKSFSTSTRLFCDVCDFPSCQFQTNELCPAFSSSRLLKHPLVPCDDSGWKFFAAAAGIVLFVFLFVVSVLYVRLIRLCTIRLQRQMQVKQQEAAELRIQVENERKERERKMGTASADPFGGTGSDSSGDAILNVPAKAKDPFGGDDEELEELLLGPNPGSSPSSPPPPPAAATKRKLTDAESRLACFPESDQDEWWKYAMEHSEPKASSLYQPFKYTFRYFLVVETIHKVSVVMSNAVWAPYSNWATTGNLGAHLLMTIALIATRPMLEPLEMRLSVILGLCSTVNSVFAVCVWQSPKTFAHEGWGISLIVINVAVPLIAGIILKCIEVRQTLGGSKSHAEKRREKEERARKKAEEAKREAELAMKVLAGNEVSDKERQEEERRKEREKEKAKELTPEQKVAEALNNQTKSTVLVFFAYISIPVLIIALALTLFATLTGESNEFVNGSNYYNRDVSVVLNGYHSMRNFSENCCCFSPPKHYAGFNTSERWVCAASVDRRDNSVVPGRTIDRGRVVSAANSGLPIRGLCSSQLVPNCSLIIDSDNNAQVSCAENFTRSQNVSDLALRTLW